ncbi:CotH kinase family protein [bacterium]|nr:CotH kinase family protein [bacterium]
MKLILTTFLFLVGSFSLVLSQDFYDLKTINTIKITFEDTNWDATMDTYYANDAGELLLGSIVINGTQLNGIGVKYKGNSTYSVNNSKNPLHIYLDHTINQDFDGYESIKLSNGKKDPSFVREVLGYEIARKYMEAPRSNYTKVYINDSYYGMFSNSEAIDSDFTNRRLDSDKDNTRIKCNPENTNNGGSSLQYLGADSALYYSYYEVKSDYGWQDLIDLTNTIKNDASNIEDILDIDKAIWMCAFNNVIVNLDSYLGPFRQNYYLIKDDNDKFTPVIWDLNESFGAFAMINSGGGGGRRPVAAAANTSLTELDPLLREGDDTYPLIKMIFENDRYKKMYVAHCKTILQENFSSGWYALQADTLQELITTDLASDPNAFYTSAQFTGNLSGTQDGVIGIKELMADRISFLNSETEFAYTQPTITNITTPDNITPYSSITITANIADANFAQLGYRYSKDDVFTKVTMYDDGNHEDGAANDGVYGASFSVDEAKTHYYIYAENANAGKFSPERAQHEYHKLVAEAEVSEESDIVINELMASNSATMADEAGEFDDWIELYNNTNSEISLLGYHLTDDDTDLFQWAFPDTSIAANDYLIVWADKDEEQPGLHAGFKLSADEESVHLVDPNFVIINTTSYTLQETDVAHARYPNGTGDFRSLASTFEYSNGGTAALPKATASKISIFPNPVSDNLFINIPESIANSDGEIKILNMLGQTIYKTTLSNDIQNTVNVSVFKSGLYLLQIRSTNGNYSQKFIKE